GVVLNLAVWFALHTIFAEVFDYRAGPLQVDVPVLSSVTIPALALTIATMVAVFRFKAGPLTVIAGAAIAGVLLWFLPV
ncbi:MAG: chromate transporter, partial [Sphingomicrobium sp.]